MRETVQSSPVYGVAGFLGVILIMCADVVMGVARVVTYPAFVGEPGAMGYPVEAAAALLAYVVVIVVAAFTIRRDAGVFEAVRVGAVLGALGGCIEIASTAVESLFALPQAIVSVVTLAAMLALFVLFGLAGFMGVWRTGRFWMGIVAAVGCAMCAVLVVLTFGLLISLTSLPQLARDMIGDPDYVRSGWTDPSAFAIANTFDAAFTHLVEAPVIAGALGALGGVAGWLIARRQSPESADIPRADAVQS